jgi:hypothetical protein
LIRCSTSSGARRIDAVRAAAHTDPTSPAGAAVRDWHETLGVTGKAIAIDNIVAESNQEVADAYLRSAAKTALLAGEIGSGAGLLGGIGQGLSGLGGGGAPSSMPKGYNLNSLSVLY